MVQVRLRHWYRAYTCTESIASQAWLGMGGQGIGVLGVPGSIPGGATTFDGVSFKWDRLEREDSQKVLGLSCHFICDWIILDIVFNHTSFCGLINSCLVQWCSLKWVSNINMKTRALLFCQKYLLLKLSVNHLKGVHHIYT